MTNYVISWDPVQGSTGYLVEYRQWGTSEWIIPTANPNPTLYTTYNLTVDGVYGYDVRVSSSGSACIGSYKYVRLNPTEGITTTTSTTHTTTSTTTTTTTTVATYYVWAANTTTCEQDGVFTLSNEYTGFASPAIAFYDVTSGKIYIGDHDTMHDSISGSDYNAYYFDPTTFTGTSSLTFVSGLSQADIYTIKADQTYRRIYFIGKNTGGLAVLDIATNSFSTVAYGTDGTDFNRVDLSILGSYIYVLDKEIGSSSLIIINRATLAIVSTTDVTTIPSGNTYLTSSYDMHLVGSNIWVTAAYRPSGDIGIYNPLFTTLVAEITSPGVSVEAGGSRYRQNGWLDGSVFYLSDAGSKQIILFNITTHATILAYTFHNVQGKQNALASSVVDPTDNQVYITYQGYNTAGEGDTIVRTFKWDSTNHIFKDIYPGVYFNNLTFQAGSNYLWGTSTGTRHWEGGSYSTDGKILKYSK